MSEWAALRDAALPEISKTEFGGPLECSLQHIYTKIGGPLGQTTVEKFKDWGNTSSSQTLALKIQSHWIYLFIYLF